MSKLSTAFSDGKAVVAYFTCGDPTLEATKEAVGAAIAGGAKILLLGIPFSDPTAVDAVIQASNIRALSVGVTTKTVFDFVKELRAETDIPVILATYANVVFSPGVKKFAAQCEAAGVQGMLLYDVPFEEQGEFRAVFQDYGVELVSAMSPSVPQRILQIASNATGLLYMITDASTTLSQVQEAVSTVRSVTKIPCVVGCGVANAAPIEAFCAEADGAVLDYEIVHIMEQYPVGARRHIIKYVTKMNDILNG